MDETLIKTSKSRRDFGQDTVQLALGRLGREHAPSDYALEVAEEECIKVLVALVKLSNLSRKRRSCITVFSTTRETFGAIRWFVRCECVTGGLEAEATRATTGPRLNPGQTCSFIFDVGTPTTGRITQLHVHVRRDRNGSYWLNVRGNPTALLTGYNAFAVSVAGRTWTSERRILLRLPFAALRRIVRSIDPVFEWTASTKARITKLAFRVNNAQVFTYLKTPIPNGTYLSFLRNCYAVPYSRGRAKHNVLADDLRLKVHAEGGFGDIETLLIRRMARHSGAGADRHVLSIAFYDKSLKAASDAKATGVDIGPEDVQRFLASHLRLDITLHAEALRQLMREARLSKSAELTAANYARAIQRLNRGEGRSGQRFMRWLLGYALDDVMALRRLLAFAPAQLKESEAILEKYNPAAAAGFAEWREQQFVWESKGRQVSFSQFVQRYATVQVSPEVARKARTKLLAVGLDPDIPLRCYTAFYNQTFVSHMSDADALAYARALEGDETAHMRRLQRQSRKAATQVIGRLRASYDRMLDKAHVPALEIGTADPFRAARSAPSASPSRTFFSG